MEGKNLHYYRLYSIYGELLTEKQRETMEDYFGLDLSLGEIAEMRGVSRQAIKYTLDTAESALMQYEEKLGFMQKASKIASLEWGSNGNLKEQVLKILEEV